MAGVRQRRWSLLLSPVFGMVFGAIIYAVIAGGVLQGTIFPDFVGCPSHTDPSTAIGFHCIRSDLAGFADEATPTGVKTWALLTVWSFAAGFLERLVPDILARIAEVGKSK